MIKPGSQEDLDIQVIPDTREYLVIPEQAIQDLQVTQVIVVSLVILDYLDIQQWVSQGIQVLVYQGIRVQASQVIQVSQEQVSQVSLDIQVRMVLLLQVDTQAYRVIQVTQE